MTEYGLRIAPWEAASNLGDGTLRKFMDDKTGEKTLTDKTYGKLAAGAQRKLGRSVSIPNRRNQAPDVGAAVTRLQREFRAGIPELIRILFRISLDCSGLQSDTPLHATPARR